MVSWLPSPRSSFSRQLIIDRPASSVTKRAFSPQRGAKSSREAPRVFRRYDTSMPTDLQLGNSARTLSGAHKR
jgi:hypothetical protein